MFHDYYSLSINKIIKIINKFFSFKQSGNRK